jgi:hypothetical protein
MKLKDACRLFTKELGFEGVADEAEMVCSSMLPGDGDIELNEQEIAMARDRFLEAFKKSNPAHARKIIQGN